MNFLQKSDLFRVIILSWITANAAFAQTGPTIDVWYGDEQHFGQLGNPQPYVNILGNVADSEGVSSLSYSLNGGPSMTLSVGPDGRRLHAPGDFNIDIATSELVHGPLLNSVDISAVDGVGDVSARTVTVEYTDTNRWPLPYSIEWSNVASIPDAVQVVDGLWEFDEFGARTTLPGYDRHLAMGDLDWDNYEVTVPVTIHEFLPWAFVGVFMRWNGNSDDPIPGWQPKTGWFPLGAGAWYNNRERRLEIYNNEGVIVASMPLTLVEGQTYMFKTRVETPPGSETMYRLKVWESDQSEPPNWDLAAVAGHSNPLTGSVVLMAVRIDVSFGDVSIIQVESPPVMGSGIVSDDFGSGVLDPEIWTFVDPQGDGSLSFSGAGTQNAWVNISVPAGATHDPWTYGILAPHLLQAANDADFEAEVKFESAVTSRYQIQGVLVKQDDSHFLRFDFYSDGSSTYLFAASVSSSTTIYLLDTVIPDEMPMYLRVNRKGDEWTPSYSYDGQSWQAGGSFLHTLTVTGVGVHCSNAGPNPAHTTSINYFVNRE